MELRDQIAIEIAERVRADVPLEFRNHQQSVLEIIQCVTDWYMEKRESMAIDLAKNMTRKKISKPEKNDFMNELEKL